MLDNGYNFKLHIAKHFKRMEEEVDYDIQLCEAMLETLTDSQVREEFEKQLEVFKFEKESMTRTSEWLENIYFEWRNLVASTDQ